MKRNLRTYKVVRYVGVVLLMLTFAFTSIGAISQTNIEHKSVTQIAISNYLVAQQSQDLSDEEKIKAAIDAYFTTRYEGQKLVEVQDFSVVVEDDSLDWVKKEKDKREIELYIASSFDLGYQSYSFTLDYDSIEIKKNKAVVQLRQSHQVVYEAIAPEISELANLPHTITLHAKDGIWVIYKDEYQDEYTKLLDTTPKDKIKQQIDENLKISQGSSSTIYGAKVHASLAFSPLALTSYSYNRSAAQTFSYNNALTTANIPTAIKNAYQATYGTTYPDTWPKKYKREIPSEGDCTNFVSQSIFEGTGYTNGDANYFYPAGNDSNWYYKFSPTAIGSTTWRRVDWLYSYLLNTSTSKRGPYGTAASSCCFCSYLNPGDPIFMKSGANWAHAVIVYTKSSPCTSPNNIRVNSHDSNKQNEPLPFWSGYAWYGVYIQGYRK
jgi:hypothetical protein